MRFHTIGFILIIACLALTGCSRKLTLTQAQSGYALLSEELQEQIKKIEKSVIGVNATIEYEITHYEYALQNGKPVRDAASPTGYKLASGPGNSGITITTDQKTLNGGGLLLDSDLSRQTYTILTSSHLVAPRDTTYQYYLDRAGAKTDVLFQRQTIKGTKIFVRTQDSQLAPAQLLANDVVDDIALIAVQTDRRLGNEYPNQPGYDMDMSWGDWVFLFGYPREVKQLTGGWVSPSPYRGTFAVDAVVRFGFSGGPVFAISKDQARLEFVGLIKSVPSSFFNYVAPDETLPGGYVLRPEDVSKLVVRQQTDVDYGTAYCVGGKRVQVFMKAARTILQSNGIVIDRKYF